MLPLEKSLRNKLERTIKEARDIAEAAAKASLDQLGVGEATPFAHLSEEERELRRRLRLHGRQLGDSLNGGKVQTMDRLIEEVAYEHWHQMLFARFLAENNLLMYDGVAVTLEECAELAADDGLRNEWELAARLATAMLPQIFRPDAVVFALHFPPEHQQRLERLVAELPLEVFTASDSLGWVYQFWQAKKKDAVNASEVKIGARELPAVTQLFTEPYMVAFLLDNALGAWWVAKLAGLKDGKELRPGARQILRDASTEEELRAFFSLPGVPLEYLRFIRLPSPSGRGAGGEGKSADKGIKKSELPEYIRQHARELRQNQTDAEQLLWNLLRDRRFAGKKFRRQHPIDRYIIDFYCHEERLAVELDGGQHNENSRQQYDDQRSAFLKEQGIRVVRFWNNDVLGQTEAVLESLWLEVNSLPSPPAPLPEGEGSWIPAAGTFAGWPGSLAELKTLDPCCGSGHFLVAAFLMLVAMRMALEGLSAREAVDAVLRDNMHGLELDQRCVELAAFALALTAWRYPESGGYRPLPELHLACSGLSVSVAKEEWKQLGLGKRDLSMALGWLHDIFRDAPVLGSLLNPARTDAARIVEWHELSDALEQALNQEQPAEQQEAAVVAQGLTKAATMLAGQYQWVITNVPYLARGKQDDRLRDFCEKYYPAAKNDLATVFLDRCLELCIKGGTASIVLPQNWLFLSTYTKFREQLLKNDTWHLIARLGPGAFETISGEVVKAILISLSREPAFGGIHSQMWSSGNSLNPELSHLISGLDVSEPRTAADKAAALITAEIKQVNQAKQLENPDAAVQFVDSGQSQMLSLYALTFHGISTTDYAHFGRNFWELPIKTRKWVFQQTTIRNTHYFSGKENILLWENGVGQLKARQKTKAPVVITGLEAWGKDGVAITQMRHLPATIYTGNAFDDNTGVLIPKNPNHLLPIWCFCSSPRYNQAIREIDQTLKVTYPTLVKVPFDLDHWTRAAAEKYPNGLPKPYSDDPTQWLFHGHPAQSDEPLQVAVARLLGYRWPAELDPDMELSAEARAWVQKSAALLPLVDDDGIVCLPPVRGEMGAADRLENLLAAAYGSDWSAAKKSTLLAQADHAGKPLETWLREKFFSQHCKLFQHRPFIWHIWDGLRDGFAALVNYHKLDHKLLETLIYTYLGDWISRQKQDIGNSVDGAQEKLAAAESLKEKLELILTGEAPYDIFIRWKPLAQQPIGWNPDLNDGVRLNIRPFLSAPDVAKKGAGVLRDKPNIKWDKDRGKDVESAPWYHKFAGDRINDHHLTLDEKRAARGTIE